MAARKTVRRKTTSATPAAPTRVGVVGLGMGRHHLNCYKNVPDCVIAGVSDVDTTRLAAAGKEYGLPASALFADAQAMFDSGLLDAVSIATPNFLHHPLTMAALKAGLHVLCEKPLAMDTAQAREMVRTAEKRGLKLGVHFNHRMTPAARAIAQYAHAGDLGEIYHARISWHRRRGIPGGPGSWFFDSKRSGGGCLIDLGVHAMDTVMSILGYPKVLAVNGQTRNVFGKTDKPTSVMDVEDFVTGYIRLEGGATIALEVSWASHHEHPEQVVMAIYGTEGGAVRRTENYVDAPIRIHRREHGNLVDVQLATLPSDTPTVQADFVKSIREDGNPQCSGDHGLAVMQILDGIYESSRTGREVRIKG
ncbi:MAG: Gfo/Idh/MocA family oxidoreductase [Planctomycetota bacterium]|nr:Gfo/Idh/MocA family oxidoreductase [Planctomycetota bacterium]